MFCSAMLLQQGICRSAAAFGGPRAALLQCIEHGTAGSRSRPPAGGGRKEISFALHRRAEYAAVSVWIWSVVHNVQLRSDAGQRKTNISFSTRTRVRRKKQTYRGAFRERRNQKYRNTRGRNACATLYSP